jgi:hypothetical protein
VNYLTYKMKYTSNNKHIRTYITQPYYTIKFHKPKNICVSCFGKTLKSKSAVSDFNKAFTKHSEKENNRRRLRFRNIIPPKKIETINIFDRILDSPVNDTNIDTNNIINRIFESDTFVKEDTVISSRTSSILVEHNDDIGIDKSKKTILDMLNELKDTIGFVMKLLNILNIADYNIIFLKHMIFGMLVNKIEQIKNMIISISITNENNKFILTCAEYDNLFRCSIKAISNSAGNTAIVEYMKDAYEIIEKFGNSIIETQLNKN